MRRLPHGSERRNRKRISLRRERNLRYRIAEAQPLLVVSERNRLETKLIRRTHAVMTTASSTTGLGGIAPSRNR